MISLFFKTGSQKYLSSYYSAAKNPSPRAHRSVLFCFISLTDTFINEQILKGKKLVKKSVRNNNSLMAEDAVINQNINKIRLDGQEARRYSWRPTEKNQPLLVPILCSTWRVYAKRYSSTLTYTVRKNSCDPNNRDGFFKIIFFRESIWAVCHCWGPRGPLTSRAFRMPEWKIDVYGATEQAGSWAARPAQNAQTQQFGLIRKFVNAQFIHKC